MPKRNPVQKEDLKKKAVRIRTPERHEQRPAIPTGLRYYTLMEIAYEARVSYKTIRNEIARKKLNVFGYITDKSRWKRAVAVVLEDEAKRYLLSRIMVKADRGKRSIRVPNGGDNS